MNIEALNIARENFQMGYTLTFADAMLIQHAIDAAMLNAGPVKAATVPDGWKIVPVEPTAEMISLGIAAHYEASQSKIYDRPVPGPMECGYMAMLAAAPAAPEQEV